MNYSDLNPEQRKIIDEIISLQIFIEEKADIKYQCYFMKWTQADFWEKYLNNKFIEFKDLGGFKILDE